MRSLLLIVGSFLLIAAAFEAYIRLQPAPPERIGAAIGPTTTPTPPVTGEMPAQQTMGLGSGVWTKSYDQKTGALASQFRSFDYTPQKDGTVDMTEPEAEFFLGGGQMLYIHGKTGNVVDPNATSGKMQGQSQNPSRGKLHDVTLKLFKLTTDTVPQFTCTMNNLAFDNDTFRIATEDCDIPDSNGKLVHTPADQVPVHVVGIDYDFDGRGLLIKWDDRNRRLQRLEVEHGEQLIVKNPAAFSDASHIALPMSTTAPTTAPMPAPTPAPIDVPHAMLPEPLRDADGPIALVSAAPDAAAAPIAGAPIAGATGTVVRPTTRPRKRKPATKPIPSPTSAPVIIRTKDPGVYRATFYDNVIVTQASDTLATADKMNVDFFMNNGGASTQPSTTQSTTQSTTAQSAIGQTAQPNAADESSVSGGARPVTPAAGDHPPVHPKPARTPTNRPVNQPATHPATQPVVPIIVHWTGKLIVIPPPPDVPPLEVGDSVLEMIGEATPAVLNRNSSVIHCASFRYHTLDQNADVSRFDATTQPLLRDANGATIFAPSLAYDGRQENAMIPGPAHAEFPATTEPSAADAGATTTAPTTRPSQTAKVDWTDYCTLAFARTDREDLAIQEAHLYGDVYVDHPQVKLRSEELHLNFDNLPRPSPMSSSLSAPTTAPSAASAATTSAQLRNMLATGDVDCTLHDSQGRLQHIISQSLILRTERGPRGNDVPSEVIADVDVHAFDDTQDLSAGHLDALLEPTPPSATPRASTSSPASAPSPLMGGDVQLRELTAEHDVHFRTTEGTFADADQLQLWSEKDANDQTVQKIELLGQPEAHVGDRQSAVTGPIIRYDPVLKEAHVVGPGTLHSIQQVASKAATQPSAPPTQAGAPATQPSAPTTRPLDITWQSRFDLVDDDVKITGGVTARTLSSDGSTNYATGDHINMTLMNAPPTTAPTTGPTGAPATSATSAPATPSSFVGGGDTNFLKNKVVDTVTLLGKGDDNVEVKSFLLAPDGSILHAMNLLAPIVIYDKPHDRFTVPTPGRMLVRDNRGQNKLTTAPSTTQPLPTEGGMHGTTAFQWQEDLVYDQQAEQAIMTGNVHIVHESPTAAPYEMFADRVITDLDPSHGSTTKPAAGDDEQSFHVKRLTALGSVRMTSARLQFDAAQCVYDPATQVMTAHSTDREPAHIFDAQGVSTGTFGELVYNTKTEQIQMKDFRAFLRKH